MSIEIDDSFASYTELQERLEEFKQATYTDLYIWDSQTIQNAAKKGIKIPMRAELRYYYIKYACVHGGKAFKGRGTGGRDSRYID